MGYPFLIFQLCERAGMEFTWHEEQLQPIKPVHTKIKYGGSEINSPRIYNSRNESNEDPYQVGS